MGELVFDVVGTHTQHFIKDCPCHSAEAVAEGEPLLFASETVLQPPPLAAFGEISKQRPRSSNFSIHLRKSSSRGLARAWRMLPPGP